ncbi:MAG TPA: GNAT family N-acetyltransferase [Bacillota bacterium]|nr:GNAT family N-acetyltransferase [Bacillota bacterium]
MEIRRARPGEEDAVYALYRRAACDEYSTWNDFYPGMEEIGGDMRADGLFVLTEGNMIIGTASIVPENELDVLDCWQCHEGSREIARVAVDSAYRGRGYALKMVNVLTEILKEQRYRAVHLSVAVSNVPALRTYKKAAFENMGEAELYCSRRYYLMEKLI